jgi:hypothetical protein
MGYISLHSVLQFSYTLLFKFFILHLPSYGADYFDNGFSLTLLVEGPLILPANRHRY